MKIRERSDSPHLYPSRSPSPPPPLCRHFLIAIEGDRPDLVRFAPDGRHLLITLSSTQRFTAYKIFPHVRFFLLSAYQFPHLVVQKNSEHGKMAEAVRTFPSKHVTELKSIQMAGQFIVTCGTDNFVNLWDVHGNVVGTLNARGMGNTMSDFLLCVADVSHARLGRLSLLTASSFLPLLKWLM